MRVSVRPLLAVTCAALMLNGCATTQRYEWGGYDQRLYSLYKNPTSKDEFRTALVAHIGQIEQSGRVPPPGLYAEAGTLFLQGGDTSTALNYYRKESVAWAESRPLMETLIKQLEKNASSGGAAK